MKTFSTEPAAAQEECICGGTPEPWSHDHVCGEDGLCDTALCKDPFGGVDTHARSAENDAQKPELKADIIKKPVNEVWGEATQILTSCVDCYISTKFSKEILRRMQENFPEKPRTW